MKFEISYWTIVETDTEEEAIKQFISEIDENSVDIEVKND